VSPHTFERRGESDKSRDGEKAEEEEEEEEEEESMGES
jgi:hypothetical protein